MTVEQFFDLFFEELRQRDNLRDYYKFHDDPSKLDFRKAYFCQRLQYIHDQVTQFSPSFAPACQALAGRKASAGKNSPNSQPPNIWDVGSGYSTTQIFLALNGIPSHGSTLEFYYKEIPERLEYWSKYGDMSLIKVSYEDIFEAPIKESSTDLIIVQDTLHHLEPLDKSLSIFYKTLRPGGIILAIEENGNCIVQNLKLYRQRGNNRIIEYYDEGLGRKVMMGNENIRPLKTWKLEMEKAGFLLDHKSVQYVRLFSPGFFKDKPLEEVTAREQRIWKKYPLLREYFFFGVNFVAKK